MSDRINLSQRVSFLDMSPEFDGVSKLICNIDDETQMIVGDDTGYAIEFDNPLMTQSVLTAMLNKIRGFQYQPYQAEGALLDPAAEMGDAVSIRDLYGGIYTRSRNFSHLMSTNISAPTDEEIDHEFKFETKQERKVKRQLGDVRATLLVQADQISAEVAQREADSAEFRSQLSIQATQIAAKVSQTGGNQASFGWSLLATEFGLYSGNTKVFWVNNTGAHVKGEITATTGKIGGFTIGASAIYNNISTFGGTQTTGVYLGTNGIQLGQNFKVTTSGNVTANNITLTGKLKIGNKNITAENLYTGANEASQRYNNWNATTNSVNTNGSTWSTGAGYGYNYNRATQANTGSYPAQFTCGRLITTYFSLNGSDVGAREITYKDGNGNTRTATFLTVQ